MRDRNLIVKHVIDYINEIYFVACGKTYERYRAYKGYGRRPDDMEKRHILFIIRDVTPSCQWVYNNFGHKHPIMIVTVTSSAKACRLGQCCSIENC